MNTPEGWKLVPVEPTPEMLDAYVKNNSRFNSARSDWAVMLAAAPTPSEQPAARPMTPDQSSRAMFVARLENMQSSGDNWLTIAAVLAMLNDCDMLASMEAAQPEQPEPGGLTDERLRQIHHEDQFGLFCDYDDFEQIARAIEREILATTRKRSDEEVARIIEAVDRYADQCGLAGQGFVGTEPIKYRAEVVRLVRGEKA